MADPKDDGGIGNFYHYLECLKTYVEINEILKLIPLSKGEFLNNKHVQELIKEQSQASKDILFDYNPINGKMIKYDWSFDGANTCQEHFDSIVAVISLPWEHDEMTLCDDNCEKIFAELRSVKNFLKLEIPDEKKQIFFELSPPKSDHEEDPVPTETLEKFHMKTHNM